MDTDNDIPKFQFRGVWAPAELFDMLAEGKLSSFEIMLLLLVESFVKSTGKDCFASNEYLATRLGRKISHVSHMIGDLKEKGLLVQSSFDGRSRYLRTVWSRLAINCEADSQKIAKQTRKKLQAINIKVENNTLPQSAGADMLHSKLTTQHIRVDPLWRRLAEQLATSISKVRKINNTSDVTAWAKWFQKLHTKKGIDKQRMKTTLKWYCSQLPTRHREQYFPVIESGKSFFEKFDKIERAMEREVNEKQESREYAGPKAPKTVRMEVVSTRTYSTPEEYAARLEERRRMEDEEYETPNNPPGQD